MPVKSHLRRPTPSQPLLLVALALVGTLAGCGAIPEAPRQRMRHAPTSFAPPLSYGQCLADLGARAATYTPVSYTHLDVYKRQ